ncbi:MAG: ABC transporter ATP-binding protein [Betaproteobacteria bacterium]
MSVLRAIGLRKSFGGVHAVRNVGFEVAAGELLAMIGPNGAGKSTCFNLVNGQLAPDSGRVLLGERLITGLAPRAIWRLGVGRTFQVTATFGSMTVRENVQVGLLSHARRLASPFAAAPRLQVAQADALLAQVGMLDQADRPAAVLAYGDLKRLELAMALANRPRLLLMDEPTAGMAAAERAALMQLTASLARASGIAVLFTEHDMDAVFTNADRVIVLADGEVIAQGAPAQVRADRRVREAYLGTEAADA